MCLGVYSCLSLSQVNAGGKQAVVEQRRDLCRRAPRPALIYTFTGAVGFPLGGVSTERRLLRFVTCPRIERTRFSLERTQGNASRF